MRKLIVLLLAFAITACGAPPVAATEVPTELVVQPTQTAVIVVETVVVTVVPTNVPTEVPSATPLPPPTDVPPTAVPPTDVPATQAVAAPADATGGAIKLDDALGKGVFANMTMSGNAFTLRCSPAAIIFNISTSNSAITDALLYYRITDVERLYPSEWTNGGSMDKLGNGNFQIVFNGEDVNPNLRLDKGWFDFQFIGLNKGGSVVDRTQKIEKLVTYSIDCP